MAAFLREQAGRTGQKNWLRQEKSQTAGGKIFQATSKVREEVTRSSHNGITIIRDALSNQKNSLFNIGKRNVIPSPHTLQFERLGHIFLTDFLKGVNVYCNQNQQNMA